MNSFYKNIHNPLFPFFGQHVHHTLSKAHPKAGQIRVCIEKLRNRATIVILYNIGGISFSKMFIRVVQIEVIQLMVFGKGRADKDVPVNEIGINTSLLGHGKQFRPESSPVSQFCII